MHRLATVLIAVASLAGAARAETALPSDIDKYSPAEIWILSQMVERSNRPSTRDEVLGNLSRYFGTLDIDGDGFVTIEDNEFQLVMQKARIRASAIGSVLANDLDGDGVVTREEITRVVRADLAQAANNNRQPPRLKPEEREAKVVAQVEVIMKADRNGDGRLTADEVRMRIVEEGSDRPGAIIIPNLSRRLLTLDGDGDGRLSLAEFESATARVFQAVDTDGNGVLSEAEKLLVAARVKERERRQQEADSERNEMERQRAALATCGLPKADPGEDVALLGTHEGAALSDTAIGPEDNRVSVGRVTVEPGKTSLYLVLTSYDPMIWQFDGAVERLTHVVVGPMMGPGGTMGLDPKVVVFPTRSDCLAGYYDKNEVRGVIVARRVEWATGKPAAVLDFQHRTTHLALPSMTHSTKPAYFGAVRPTETAASRAVWGEFRRYNPGGLIHVDPAQLVAARPAHRLRVLPNYAGLAQLIDEGLLEPVVMRTDYGQPPQTFRIVGKTTLPEGLSGALSVHFILKRGVPMPDGDLGHSCIVPEDSSVPARGHC